MTTWSDILTGDVVLGHDGLAWYVERDGKRFTLHRPDRGTPVAGRPDPAAPVRRLFPSSTTLAVATLQAFFPHLSIVDHR
ncbi:MAG TPA: hypothetical protein VFB74_33995 [Kribbellaceae bacterium]|nr:hypothetical protein [Kribbellaceae bacterium]